MPLKKGKSMSTISENIEEFHKGKTYARTLARFGKAHADRQAIAVAYASAGKSRKR